MSEQLSSSFILFFWILAVCLSPLVRGQVQVIGSSEVVVAHVGADVVLPCRADPPVDLTPLTVEWSRAELRPHPSDRLKRVPFVHVYTDHRDDDPDMKIPEYTNRTQLFPGQFPEGVASLRIKAVALSDNGTYKCFVPNLPTKKSLRWTYVTLVVDAPDTTTAPTPTPDPDPRLRDTGPDGGAETPSNRNHMTKVIVISVFMAMVILVPAFIIYKRSRQTQAKVPLPQSAVPGDGADVVTVQVEDTTPDLSKLLLPNSQITCKGG